jgi:prepilin-type N-terminal cleavage/methylation domain-containing protein/prepilin-type processing-associated H-X9-DG protein
MRRRGFTLIELLVTVAIIALLIAILLPSLGRAREQTRMTKCGANLKQIFVAVASYAGQNNDIVVSGKSGYTRPDFNNNNNLLGWGETLYIDGNLQQKVVGGTGLAGLANVHYPILRWSAEYGSGNVSGNSIFTCPSANAAVQFNVLTAGANATYGLSPWATTHWDASSRAADGSYYNNPIIIKMSMLNPSKVFGADGGYNMAAYRATSQPGGTNNNQFQYWVYLRHFGKDTKATDNAQRFKGKANYVFSDGHVEAVSDDRIYRDVPPLYTAKRDFDRSPWYQNPTGRD